MKLNWCSVIPALLVLTLSTICFSCLSSISVDSEQQANYVGDGKWKYPCDVPLDGPATNMTKHYAMGEAWSAYIKAAVYDTEHGFDFWTFDGVVIWAKNTWNHLFTWQPQNS